MKVIKENHFENTFPMRIQCKRVVDCYGFVYGNTADFCGSELEIEAEDIKKHPWSKYPDYSGLDYGVKCPVCGKFVVVDSKLIPEKIKKEAKEIVIS